MNPHGNDAAALSGRAGSDTAAVELIDVSFAYDVRPVLEGITMTIPRGKIVAIMGGSGCGKTTILRLIGGAAEAEIGQRARRRPVGAGPRAGCAVSTCVAAAECCSSSARCSPT